MTGHKIGPKIGSVLSTVLPWMSMGGEQSLHMDASPEDVWALVSDVTRIGEFSPETFEARWRRGSTGPELGARFKGHVKRNGVPAIAVRSSRKIPAMKDKFSVMKTLFGSST